MATAMLTSDRGMRRKLPTAAHPQVNETMTLPTAAVITASKPAAKKTAPKRKNTTKTTSASRATATTAEQNNNIKRQRLSVDNKDDMLATYQPWVIQTYGDLAKTKTVTLKKYARILRTLRGEEVVSADNSKFRFWVKAKGFYVGKPASYDPKPADAIVGRYSVCDADEGIPPVNEKLSGSAKDPPLYVPNAPFKNSTGEPVYRKVAVVENFFDIIYNVHVELEGRPGKHAGQKRTYRTITETYAFLPREAVTRFLLGCTECQKHPRSPSPASVLPTPSPSPTLPLMHTTTTPLLAMGVTVASSNVSIPPAAITSDVCFMDMSPTNGDNVAQSLAPPPQNHLMVEVSQHHNDISQSQCRVEGPLRTSTPEPKRSSNPLDVCNLTSRDPPRTPPKKRHLNHLSDGTFHPQGLTAPSSTPKLWSPVESIEREQYQQSQQQHQPQNCKKRILMAGDIDYSLPITTTYLKYMRSLGCTDEDALKFENKHVSLVLEHFMHEAISHYFY